MGLALFLLFGVSAVPARAEYVTKGYGGPSFAAAGVSAPTGDKPQSKLWYAQDSWWGALFVPASLASDGNAGYKIHRLDWRAQRWIDTGMMIDSRPGARLDVLWDGSSLYAASAGIDPLATGDSIQISKFAYDGGTEEYVPAPGFPVTIVDGGTEAVVLDRDTTGTLWITYTRDQKVYVSRSNSDDVTWLAPYVIPVTGADSLSDDDISAVVSFNGKVGVMWSSTAAWETHAMYFATHVDGAPDSEWTVVPALQMPGYADDHINLKSLQADARGQVFAATKTSKAGAADELILLLVLDTHGSWKRHTFSNAADSHTRPLVLLDPVSDRIHMFAAAPGGPGGVVYHKSSPMSHISFEPGLGTPFIQSDTDVNINNAASTKQTVTPSTGLVVLASDDHTKRYLHNSIDLGTPDTISPDTKIVSAPIDTEPDFSPAYRFESNEVGATFEVSLDGGEYVASGTVFRARRLSAGSHLLTVRAVDVAGNVDPIPETWIWTIDPFVVNIDAGADAYFDEALPGANRGSELSLIVDADTVGGREARAVLRFVLPPGSAVPDSAALHLYAYNGVSVNGPSIFRTYDPWDESTVTWLNQPTTPEPPLSQVTTIPADTWAVFDLGSTVVGEGTYDFLLDQSSRDGVFFFSREVPVYRPHIALRYDTAPNQAPEIDPIGDMQGAEGTEIRFQAKGWDPLGDTLEFSLTNGPAAATIDSSTGDFSWTPTDTDGPAEYPVTVRITDPDGLAAETSLTLTVLDTLYTLAGTVTDERTDLPLAGVEMRVEDPTGVMVARVWSYPDGSYQIPGLPVGDYRARTVDAPNYFDEWWDGIPYAADPDGATATAIDLTGDRAGVDFHLSAIPAPDTTPPVITVAGVVNAATYTSPVTPTFSASDPNLASVTATLNGAPFTSGTNISTNGAKTLVVTAVDTHSNQSTKTITFTVAIDTTPPVITVAGVANAATYTSPVTPTFSASDPNLASVTATLNGAPFTSGTTVVSNGAYALLVTAKDAKNNTSIKTVSFTLAQPARPLYTTIRGADRYQTAALISKAAYPSGAPVVFLVKGDDYPDALAAGPLAAAYGGPIIITPSTGLNDTVRQELKRLKPARVFVIGLPPALNAQVEATLGIEPDVIRGADRYHTAALIAQALRTRLGKVKRVVLVAGDNFPDALAAGPVAAEQGWPILLTPQSGALPAATRQKILDLGVKRVVRIGNWVALPSGIASDDLVGTDRYHTSALVAEYGMDYGLTFGHVALVKGDDFPDALVVGPYLKGVSGTILLTASTAIPVSTVNVTRAHIGDVRVCDIVGLSNAIRTEMETRFPSRTP